MAFFIFLLLHTARGRSRSLLSSYLQNDSIRRTAERRKRKKKKKSAKEAFIHGPPLQHGVLGGRGSSVVTCAESSVSASACVSLHDVWMDGWMGMDAHTLLHSSLSLSRWVLFSVGHRYRHRHLHVSSPADHPDHHTNQQQNGVQHARCEAGLGFRLSAPAPLRAHKHEAGGLVVEHEAEETQVNDSEKREYCSVRR